MLTSTNRSRGFPAIINSQIASNLDNWQIVFLTNQSLHSNPTHLTRCMAHSSISHLCLDGTYCLPQHLSMGLCMFHLEKKIIKPASILMQTCQMSEANLQLCKFMEGLLKVGHPPPFLHLQFWLCGLGEALKHRANLLLPEMVVNRLTGWELI